MLSTVSSGSWLTGETFYNGVKTLVQPDHWPERTSSYVTDNVSAAAARRSSARGSGSTSMTLIVSAMAGSAGRGGGSVGRRPPSRGCRPGATLLRVPSPTTRRPGGTTTRRVGRSGADVTDPKGGPCGSGSETASDRKGDDLGRRAGSAKRRRSSTSRLPHRRRLPESRSGMQLGGEIGRASCRERV